MTTSSINKRMLLHIPYLSILIIACLISACNTNNSEEVAVENEGVNLTTENYYLEAHRPQFHFSPADMWTNDPNGMVYLSGEYHLFYQHYPDSTIWGPMHWGHAVSKNLVHWEHLPIALYPDELGYIFSGSAVIDWNNTSGFGDGVTPPMIAIFTYHDMAAQEAGGNNHETQGIAYSADRGRTWTKYSGNPVIPNPGGVRDIRDPKVIWDDTSDQWVMVLAVGDHMEFWSSPDLKAWEKLSDFGQDLGNHDGVWECPDLFPMTVDGSAEKKWVLIANINPGHPNGGSGTQYFIGDFDGKHFLLDERFTQDVQEGNGVWLDYGKDNYAGVTWSDVPDEDGRRIFIGWMSNWQYANLVPTEKWRNAMTLPRSLSLKSTNEGYRIFSTPVEEIRLLRKTTIELEDQEISGVLELNDLVEFSTTLSELELEFNLGSSRKGVISIELYNKLGESYSIGFDIENNQYFSDRLNAGKHEFSEDFAPKISIAPRRSDSNTIRMHLFIDWASAELFADDGATVMTEIFFPSENFDHIRLKSEGSQVQLLNAKVHQLQNIWR